MSEPLILVTNDDGYLAPGVRALIRMLTPFGRVIAACPDSPRSAQSMAITVNSPLRINRDDKFTDAELYMINGTPVDCVKLAMSAIVPRRPDIIVSGINHGSNSAVNVIYSGTMGAVFEGCAFGIPSVGFSLTSHSMKADFEPCRPFVSRIVDRTLQHGLPNGLCLNVNIPADAIRPPHEMRVVRACRGKWTDEYERYSDPLGRDFFWLTGKFVNDEPDATDTDEWCLSHGIVSVVPTLLDRTAPPHDVPDWVWNINSDQVPQP